MIRGRKCSIPRETRLPCVVIAGSPWLSVRFGPETSSMGTSGVRRGFTLTVEISGVGALWRGPTLTRTVSHDPPGDPPDCRRVVGHRL